MVSARLPKLARAAVAALALAAGSARAADPAAPQGSGATGPAPSQETRAPAPAEPAPPAPAPAEPPGGPAGGEETGWIDTGHHAVESILGRVLELDRFFSDETILDPIREKSFLRWRNELHVSTGHHPRFFTALSATLRFPGLERWWRDRLRLVVEGVSQDAPETLFPDQEAPPASQQAPQVVRDAAAELRYSFINRIGVDLDTGVGVLLRLPPGAIVRSRFRYALPFRDVLLARAALTGFWRTDLHLGSTASVDLQRALGSRTFVRLGGGATVNQVELSRGLQWSAELAFPHALGPRSAVSLAAAIWGVTRPVRRVDEYRVYARYRRDLFRRWFFVELEPEIAWPLDPPGVRRREYGGTIRLEVQFSGDVPDEPERRRPSFEPDPRNPEPPDPA